MAMVRSRLRAVGWTAVIVGAAGIMAACQGSVTDPVGDERGFFDIVKVSVSYQTDVTTLSMQFDRGGAAITTWLVSFDEDTTSEAIVEIGRFDPQGGENLPDYYTVILVRTGQVICAGFVKNAGSDGVDTTTLTIDSRCLLPIDGPAPPLPSAVRVAGESATQRGDLGDLTDFTSSVALSSP
jgi:hypothetical protein